MPRPQRNAPRYPRTARVNELVRQIVAESLERVDDERLELVAITQVVVDADLRHATVYYDALGGADVDSAVLEAFAEQRVRLQAAIGRQARLKRTPELLFKADDVERTAGRVDDIIRTLNDHMAGDDHGSPVMPDRGRDPWPPQRDDPDDAPA